MNAASPSPSFSDRPNVGPVISGFFDEQAFRAAVDTCADASAVLSLPELVLDRGAFQAAKMEGLPAHAYEAFVSRSLFIGTSTNKAGVLPFIERLLANPSCPEDTKLSLLEMATPRSAAVVVAWAIQTFGAEARGKLTPHLPQGGDRALIEQVMDTALSSDEQTSAREADEVTAWVFVEGDEA